LADFETNFDRALLSVGSKQQAGGEDTGASPADAQNSSNTLGAFEQPEAAGVEGLLLQELSESRQRMDKLESLNAALVHRSSTLEGQLALRSRELSDYADRVSRLEMEKRMAEMEAERAIKNMEQNTASCAEMQMEINLLTKSSVTANARAAQGEAMIKTVKTDRTHVHELESKVNALQEWALASSETKTLAQERVRFLENQLKSLQRSDKTATDNPAERSLMVKHGSFVVGAGDVGARVFTLTADQVKSVLLSERVVLRWRFDLIPSEDSDISFSVMRGACDTPALRRSADFIIKNRAVKSGAAGETESAFTQRACTIEWDNSKSWIRPKTVKYEVEAIVLSDD
jgi:hypothetical protein